MKIPMRHLVKRLGMATLALLFTAVQVQASAMMLCAQPEPSSPASCHEEVADAQTTPSQPEATPPCCAIGLCAGCALSVTLPQSKRVALLTALVSRSWPPNTDAHSLLTDAPERPPKAA